MYLIEEVPSLESVPVNCVVVGVSEALAAQYVGAPDHEENSPSNTS